MSFFCFNKSFDCFINRNHEPYACKKHWTNDFINDKPINELNNFFVVDIRYIVSLLPDCILKRNRSSNCKFDLF